MKQPCHLERANKPLTHTRQWFYRLLTEKSARWKTFGVPSAANQAELKEQIEKFEKTSLPLLKRLGLV